MTPRRTLILKCFQVLLTDQSEQSMLQGLCDALTTHCGYSLAWVGYNSNDGPAKDAVPMAWSGTDNPDELRADPASPAERGGFRSFPLSTAMDLGSLYVREPGEGVAEDEAEVLGVLTLMLGKSILGLRDSQELKNGKKTIADHLDQVKARERDVVALLEGAKAVMIHTDFNTAARRVFDICRDVIGATAGYVAMLSDDGQENEVLFLEAGGRKCSVNPDLPMPIRGLRAEAYRTGGAALDNDFHNSEWMRFMPPGHVRLDNVMFAPLNLDGRTVGIMGLANKSGDFDHRDQMMAEAFGDIAAIALRNSKQLDDIENSRLRFYQLFEGIDDGVAVYEAVDGGEGFRFLDINPAGCRITGKAKEELVGELVTESFPGIMGMGLLEVFREVWSSGVTQEKSLNKYEDDRLTFWTKNTVYKLRTGELVVMFADLTAEKAREDRQAELESSLRQAQKMEAVGTLAGGIAHDFNNILAAILGYSELALEDAEDGRATPDELRQIMAAASRAKDLVKHILAFSRKAAMSMTELSANKVVEYALVILKNTLPKMISVRTELTHELPDIAGDVTQLEQVIINLATNAADAMPTGGEIVIGTKVFDLQEEYARKFPDVRPGEHVMISVSDTGCGMDRETQTHIFEPFYTTKEIGKGTGLGLSSAYGIIKSHKGHISCYSEPAKGTTFKVYLPVARTGDTIQEHNTDLKSGASIYQKGTILLVDDEKNLLDLGGQILERQGYRVISAENGEQALEVYEDKGNEVDLVIMDLSMPGMGGHQCLMEILNRDPEARIVVASGYSMSGPVDEIMAAGPTDFISKPYSKAELLNIVTKNMPG